MPNLSDWLKPIGEFVSSLTAKVLQLIPNELLASPNTARILSILVVLVLTYIVLHFIKSIQPIVKVLIIIVSVLLVISIASTFIP